MTRKRLIIERIKIGRSYDHSHDLSCDSPQQIAKPIAACDQNSISPNIHDRLYVFKSTEIARPKIARSGVTQALAVVIYYTYIFNFDILLLYAILDDLIVIRSKLFRCRSVSFGNEILRDIPEKDAAASRSW